MQTYYGLNRQGAAASGRYTRTPVPMGVPGIKSPFAAQALYNEPAQLATLQPPAIQRSLGMPGQGEVDNQPGSGYSSPQAEEAARDFRQDGLYNPFGGITDLGKKIGATGVLGLALGATPEVALNFAGTAINPITMAIAGVKTVDQALALNRSAVASAPGYQRAEEAALMQDRPYRDIEAEKLGVRLRNYSPTYGEKLKTVFGGQDMAVSNIGTGTPGSLPGDFGHEERMGLGVGDVAGTQETTGISGTGDKPVGRDYGNRTEPGGGGEDRGGFDGGLDSAGAGDIGDSMGRDGGVGLA